MALVSGAILVVAGIARLGFVTELLSKPIRYGYMNGIALTVLISQLPKLFGFKISSAGPLRDLWSIAGAIANGKVNWVEFALGAATLAAILLVKRRKRFPGILLAMIGATAVTAFFDLAERENISVLGSLPRGLPAFSIPLDSVRRPGPGCHWRLCCRRWCRSPTPASFPEPTPSRTGSRVDPNQEMVGLGAANLAAGLFQGFPDQQQFVAHPGRRGRRLQNSANRRGWRAPGRPASIIRAGPSQARPDHRAGRSRHLVGDRPVRGQRPQAAVQNSAMGVLAVDGVLCGRRRLWRHRGSRHRRGDRSDRVSLGRLASPFGGVGTGRGRQGLSRHHALSQCAPTAWAGAVPLGRAAVFRQRGIVQGPRARRCSKRLLRRSNGWSSRRSP